MAKMRIPKVMQLAEQLESHITELGLQAGEQYMNAAEVAKHLRVSASMANRVLQILDERGIVERAQRKGTIISNPKIDRPVHGVKRVHMITFSDTVKQTGLMTDPVIVGIQRKLPGCSIQFNFLPPQSNHDHLAQLLAEARRSPEQVGIVLTRAPFRAQKMVEESGIPTVVHGYIQPAVSKLASITVDYDRIGELIGEHFVGGRGSQLVLVLPERALLPGDYRLIRGIKKEMKKASCSVDAIKICCLPEDPGVIREWLETYLNGSGGKVMMVCHPEMLAVKPWNILKKVTADSEVVVVDEHGAAGSVLPKPLPRIYSPVPEVEVGVHIADLLNAQMEGKKKGLCEVLPVEMGE